MDFMMLIFICFFINETQMELVTIDMRTPFFFFARSQHLVLSIYIFQVENRWH